MQSCVIASLGKKLDILSALSLAAAAQEPFSPSKLSEKETRGHDIPTPPPEADSRATNGISGRSSQPPHFLLLQANAAPTQDPVQILYLACAPTI